MSEIGLLPDVGGILTQLTGSPGLDALPLDHAIRAGFTLWALDLHSVDLAHRDVPQVAEEIWRGRSDRHREITAAIDDEAMWVRGNRLGSAVVITSDPDERMTAGEMIMGFVMVAALWNLYPASKKPLTTLLVAFGERYDILAAGLNSGLVKHPRRPQQALPPIARPPAIRIAVNTMRR